MKKLFLLLTAAIACGVGAMAQDSRVATLQHGTHFRTYYGTDAFISAHNDASDGDVITLTAGVFNLCDVTKALTIRGEGMQKTVLQKSIPQFKIPMNNLYSLSLEGLTVSNTNTSGTIAIESTGGFATITISKCVLTGGSYYVKFTNCNAVVMNSEIKIKTLGNCNSSITCINSKMTTLEGGTFDVQNCVITGTANVSNSIIKNSIVYGVTTLNDTNESSHCLVKEGSSGFDNSWYVKTVAPEPDPWDETPSTYVLWDELFTGNYHLTAEASQNYIGTDGTEIGIYGGAYPYDITPDYPLVKNIEVKGIHENGKLSVKINVE